ADQEDRKPGIEDTFREPRRTESSDRSDSDPEDHSDRCQQPHRLLVQAGELGKLEGQRRLQLVIHQLKVFPGRPDPPGLRHALSFMANRTDVRYTESTMPEQSDPDNDSVEPHRRAEGRAAPAPADNWVPPPADDRLKGTVIESDPPQSDRRDGVTARLGSD